MKVTVKVEGLRELERALLELPKATARSVVRQALLDAAEPIAADAKASAPVASGELRSSIIKGTKLSRRQKAVHRRWIGSTPVKTPAGWRSAPAKAVYVFAGAGTNPQAHLQEFGTADQPPQAFMRPAWDANKESALAIVAKRIAERIEAARVRLARKAERLARSMKR